MSIDIKKIISKESVARFTDKEIQSINESVNAEISKQTQDIESKTSERFNDLVESITRKFDDQVNNVIVENVKSNVGKTINAKMYGIIKDIVGLLENAGIATTETTKEIQKKLKVADINLEKSYREREAIKSQLDSAETENLILTKMKGMKPEVINAALEYFRGKTALEVVDEIDAFTNGDFSDLVLGEEDGDELVGEIKLNDVKDALNGLDRESVLKEHGPSETFESLGRGLKQSRVIGGSGRNANVTLESLEYASNQSTGRIENEDDAKEALGKIDDFNNLGYKFR